MRRRLLVATIFLLAGAVVNVAVAWTIAAHLETLHMSLAFNGVVLEHPESFKWWTTHAPDGFANRATRVELSSPIKGASVVLATSGRRNESYWKSISRGQVMVRLRTGWPMRSMEGARRGHEYGVSLYREATVGGDFGANLDIFPLRPFLAGFVFNSLFYAGILWLLLTGPCFLWRFIRRHLRRRRGLCPECAYPMGESSVCSECGNKLPKRVRPAT